MAKAGTLEISENDRVYFETLARSETVQAQIAQRARILLLRAEGIPEITDDEKACILNIACQRPYDLGCPGVGIYNESPEMIFLIKGSNASQLTGYSVYIIVRGTSLVSTGLSIPDFNNHAISERNVIKPVIKS